MYRKSKLGSQRARCIFQYSIDLHTNTRTQKKKPHCHGPISSEHYGHVSGGVFTSVVPSHPGTGYQTSKSCWTFEKCGILV